MPHDVINPLLPGGFDIVWALVAISMIALAAVALWTVWSSKISITLPVRVLISIAIFAMPIVASTIWLLAFASMRRKSVNAAR